ncbi:Zinc finger protein GLIS1 [Schistosoma japonicum]|nr:Zinc finger protein GLIS1 [Schistosoma japonicum]
MNTLSSIDNTNVSCFPIYPLSNMKYDKNIDYSPVYTIHRNESKSYLHQNLNEIKLTNQEYEIKNKNIDQLYSREYFPNQYNEIYPHYYPLITTSLPISINSQLFNKEYSSITNKLTNVCYLCDHIKYQDDYRQSLNTSLTYSHSSKIYSQHSIKTNYSNQTMMNQMYENKEMPIYYTSEKYDNTEDVKQMNLKLNERKSNVIGTQTLICQWKSCHLTFTDHKSFVNHIESSHVNSLISNKEYYCYWEGCRRQLKPFNARYKLIVHLRIHNGDRPNKCMYPDCFKAFSRLENLKIHIRSHTGERPFVCQQDGCNRTFSNSSDRAKHQRTHIHIKPYACKIFGCTKRYTDPSSLRKHSKSHSILEMNQHDKNDSNKDWKFNENNLLEITPKCSSQSNITMKKQSDNVNDSQRYNTHQNNVLYSIYKSYDNTIPAYCMQNNLQSSNMKCIATHSTKLENDVSYSCNSFHPSTINQNYQSQMNLCFDKMCSCKVDPTLSRSHDHMNEYSTFINQLNNTEINLNSFDTKNHYNSWLFN